MTENLLQLMHHFRNAAEILDTLTEEEKERKGIDPNAMSIAFDDLFQLQNIIDEAESLCVQIFTTGNGQADNEAIAAARGCGISVSLGETSPLGYITGKVVYQNISLEIGN